MPMTLDILDEEFKPTKTTRKEQKTSALQAIEIGSSKITLSH